MDILEVGRGRSLKNSLKWSFRGVRPCESAKNYLRPASAYIFLKWSNLEIFNDTG